MGIFIPLFLGILNPLLTADALQRMLSVTASGQNLAQFDPKQMTDDLKAARESLVYSLSNLDIMLDLINQIENL